MLKNQEVILSLRNINKTYVKFPALDDVSFDIIKGEIHGLVGENGAGKSTLIKTIACAHKQTSGEIFYKGEPFICKDPHEAIAKGIGVVYQEFNLFPNLSVYENIFFGVEPLKNNLFLDRKTMIEKSQEILKRLGFSFDVTARVSTLSPALQQATEIAKCINHNCELIIMDEPSAPLTDNEVDKMFEVVQQLNAQGITIIYISHKLNEVFKLTDRVTVLRDGHYITTLETKKTNENELIKLMVGREIKDIYPTKQYSQAEVVLRVNNLNSDKIHNVSFELKKGEILGFGGLVGAGRTETMRLLFGADRMDSGTIEVNGTKVNIKSPKDAIKYGIGLIPEDRKNQGLVLNDTVYTNYLLPSIDEYSKKFFVDFKTSEKDIQEYYDILKTKATGQDQKVLYLSGGNQQKVVLGKWLLKNCNIIILDEPTRGIDVGTKQEIYQLIKNLALEGKAVIVVSSEMPELIGVSHRILVMHEGSITGELSGQDMTQENIMTLAS